MSAKKDKSKPYKLAEPSPIQDYIDTVNEHKEWKGLMDKELVALVLEGKADANEVEKFVFARKVRKYS